MPPLPVQGGNVVQIPAYPVTSTTISYDSSTASTAFNSKTRMIRVRATTDCFLAFGTSPTATSSSHFLAAAETQDFGVEPSDKVAAIKSTVAGTLYITEFGIGFNA